MRLKIDENGHVVVRGGSPVYVGSDGKDVTFDAPTLMARAEKAESLLTVRDAFSTSKTMASDRLALPAAMVRATFENAFRIEDGKIVALDQDGEKIFSRQRPGEIADFDEALDLMIHRHPSKDAILKKDGGASTGTGGGAKTAQTVTNQNGRPTMKRDDFEALNPQARMAHIKAGGVLA